MSWRYITVEKYQNYRKAAATPTDKPSDRLANMVAALDGIEPQKVKEFYTIKIIGQILEQHSFLNELPKTVKERPKLIKRVNGTRYRFESNIYNHNASVFIDAVELLKNGNDLAIDNLHLMLSLLAKPTKRWFIFKPKAKDLIGISEDMKRLDMQSAYELFVFFCKVWRVSQRVIKDYSMMERKVVRELENALGGL